MTNRRTMKDEQGRAVSRFIGGWKNLHPAARWYLVHVALLTSSLAIPELLFNFAILSFGYSRVELGRLNLVAVWASVVLSLPLWWLVTKIGLRTALLLHVAIQAIAMAMYALAPSLPALLVASAVAGGASVLYQVSAPPLMMRYSDSETRDYLFTANSALAIGLGGLTSVLAGALPGLFGALFNVAAENALAYRWALGVATAGLVMAIFPLLRLPFARPTETILNKKIQQQQANPVWMILRSPWAVLALLVAPLLVSIGAALLLPYLNLFFKQSFGLSDPAIGVIFALLNVATGAAILLGPILSARLGKPRTIAITQALSIPFLLAMGFLPMLAVVVGAALVRGALFNMARPLYDAFAMEQTEEALRPIVIGLIGGASTVGYLFAPEVSTQIQERYGFGPLFLLTAVCYTLATLAVAALYVWPRRSSDKTLQSR